MLQTLGVIPFLLLAAFTAGLAMGPAILAYDRMVPFVPASPPGLHYSGLGIALVLAYLVYGFSLILIAPLFNMLLGGRLSAWRGPQVSLGAMRWYVHCTMTLLPRLSFLEFICPTEFQNWYYRLMGMKIGRGVSINSVAIADPSLLTLDDHVTLGGSCSVMGHYAQGGYLILAPTHIKRGATIGLRAIIMGGVTVGEKAKVMAGSFVLPKTVIPDGETWGGIPAVKVDLHPDHQEHHH